MERERHSRDSLDRHPDGLAGDDQISEARAACEELLAATDHLLDSLHIRDAEDYLSANRQRGGQ